MKVLPSEKFSNLGHSIEPRMLCKIDFNVISEIESPVSMIFKNGFSSEIIVGYHTNVVRLVGQLVYLGSTAFVKYLENFSKHYGVNLSLLEAIKDGGLNLEEPTLGIDDGDVDSLISFLAKHRAELVEFINQLKKFRPNGVSKSFKSFREIDVDSSKFYISTLEVFDMEIINPTILNLTSNKLIGCFNLEYPFEVPSNYNEKVEELSSNLESYGLGFCIESIVDSFKSCNNDLFSPNAFRLSIYSMPMIYGFVYDVVCKKIRKLVKTDVNEG